MTPPRRRPPLPPPSSARRPRVAGLRKPEAETPAADTPLIEPVVEPAGEPISAAPASSLSPEPAEPEPTKVRLTPRPRPTGKHREVATPVADSVLDDQPRRHAQPEPAPFAWQLADTEPAPLDDADVAPRPRSPLLVPVILAVIAVVLGGFATWFGLQWAAATGGSVASNTALTDNAGTADVNGQITSAINTTFSYNYTDVAKTEQAAQGLLTGTALCQYNTLFKVIQQQAPAQKLVLTTTVTSSGVESLQGDSARVLMVVDQSDTRVSTNQPVFSQASLAVNAVRQAGRWKISYIDDFDGSTVQNCPK